MASNSTDVIITDGEFLKAAIECMKYCQRLKSVVDKYKDTMDGMTRFGINDLLITNNINQINFEVMKYSPMLDDVGKEIKDLVDKYILEIDSIDNFKY